MNNLSILIFTLFLAFNLNAQNKWTVLAGGTPDTGTPDPYFSPKNLVIQVGDTVVWENIQGWHDIKTTAGPETFNYGPAGSNWTHQFIFTMAGTYNYECSVGTHALTQFGSIQVVDEQTKYTIVAGGTPDADTPAPYFSPKNLLIQQGDTVIWENIQGWHDITTTAGPETFDYDPAGSGWTHQFIFTMAGTYDYECSVGTHALTQFGNITVEAPTVSTDELNTALDTKVHLYPNPGGTIFNLEWKEQSSSNIQVVLTDMFGRTVHTERVESQQDQLRLDLQHLNSGNYFISLRSKEAIIWSSLLQILK